MLLRTFLHNIVKLRNGHVLDLEEVLIVRNVFQHCILNLSPNGWRQVDADNDADTGRVLLAQFAWPHGTTDDLGLLLLGRKEEPRNYFYSFCKLKPHLWSSKPSRDLESGVNPLIVTTGVYNTLVGNADTVRGVEESLKESISLSREIDKYTGVQSFMQNMRCGPFGTAVREGSVNSRKKLKTTPRTANIILSSAGEGSPARELRRKKGKDHVAIYSEVALIATVFAAIPSPPNSPSNPQPPLIPPTDDTFRVIVDYCPPGGFMKFTAFGGKRADKNVLEVTIKKMDEQQKVTMANMRKEYKEALENGPFNARGVNIDALSHLTGVPLDFNIHFSSGVAWKEFVEKWKNFSELYFIENPVETSVAPIARHEEDGNEGEGEGEDEGVVEPQDISTNS
ncbi:hypothetical protein PVK06_035320 [Gossypium arboreum]|uniref:Uncharacterized protein n=1 Tax=Gossypium arboreum TaxID=29729 RepID=A0ABR0NHG1_GOSAR|nr:hypothetical protein PVK06_035320 [Gossypium arboreum]